MCSNSKSMFESKISIFGTETWAKKKKTTTTTTTTKTLWKWQIVQIFCFRNIAQFFFSSLFLSSFCDRRPLSFHCMCVIEQMKKVNTKNFATKNTLHSKWWWKKKSRKKNSPNNYNPFYFDWISFIPIWWHSTLLNTIWIQNTFICFESDRKIKGFFFLSFNWQCPLVADTRPTLNFLIWFIQSCHIGINHIPKKKKKTQLNNA